jgi:hypothetical protein
VVGLAELVTQLHQEADQLEIRGVLGKAVQVGLVVAVRVVQIPEAVVVEALTAQVQGVQVVRV